MPIRAIRPSLAGVLAATCASAAFGFGTAALAQNPDIEAGTPQLPQQQHAPIDVTEQQVETFAKAQERVVEIGQKWNQQIQAQGEASPEDIRKARQSAHREMVIAVEATGMSVDDYNRIAMAVQSDPALQKRVHNAR